MSAQADDLRALSERALTLIDEGSVIGLGTGHAARAFIEVLGERVRSGFRVSGVPTSQASASLAQDCGIPVTALEKVESLDVDVDGADEVDPHGNLIKGHGGALVREKIVAASSRRLLILVGAEKLVPILGAQGALPVEVVPFGMPLCRRRLTQLGCVPAPRMQNGQLFVTDNGNHILDCRVQPIERPLELERAIRTIPGVVDCGLFLGFAPTVLVSRGTGVEVLARSNG